MSEITEQKWDIYCWKCMKKNVNLKCSTCIRSFHKKCVKNQTGTSNWVCGECFGQAHSLPDESK